MSELNFLDTGGNKQKITTPAVNSMAFNTANTERVRIDSTGKVKIGGGTASLALLHIAPADYSLNLQNNSNNKSMILFAKNGTPNDSRSWIEGNGELNGYVAIGAGDAERFRINNYGLVTRPFQYHLHADRSGTLTGYDAGGSFGTPMVFNRIVSETKDSSLNSCFNTSNGLFTAPVTGVYLFNAAVYSGSGNIFGQSWFTLNGSRCTATDWVINSNYAFIQNFQQIRLAAGNTVGFHPYASGQNNVTIYENNNHTYFKVSLIG